jgi:hypothetical protein
VTWIWRGGISTPIRECIRMRVSEAYFPKQESRSGVRNSSGGGGRRTRSRGIAAKGSLFRLLMERSPEDVKLGQGYELGDEEIFRALPAGRPNLAATLSDEERRKLPDAAQNNNASAVRLMLEAGWPVEARGVHGLTALDWAACHGN